MLASLLSKSVKKEGMLPARRLKYLSLPNYDGSLTLPQPLTKEKIETRYR